MRVESGRRKNHAVVKWLYLMANPPPSPLSPEAPAALDPATSLTVLAVRWLRQALADRVWIGSLPGERELCGQIGVSRPTLRLALQQIEKDGLVELVHGRRRRIVNPPSPVAPAVPAKRMIGMLLPELGFVRLPFQSGIFETMRNRLDKIGLRIETHVSASCFSGRPDRALEKLTALHRPDTWLLVHSPPRTQNWFARNRVPCVVSGSCEANTLLPSVDIDHAPACRHAVGVLARAGRKNIVLLTPNGAQPGDVESEAEFLAATAANVETVKASILRHEDSVAGVMSALDASLSHKAAPDAIIIARPSYALVALTHLQRKGCRIPKDVAMIARSDDPMLDFATPRIACYRADAAVYGRQLADALAEVVATGFGSHRRTRQLPVFMTGETV